MKQVWWWREDQEFCFGFVTFEMLVRHLFLRKTVEYKFLLQRRDCGHNNGT